MGFTHIWYTGIIRHATKTDYSSADIPQSHPAIVKGNAGSPYAIADYYDVCPDLAVNVDNRMEEFVKLVERTHKQGLKMIIDFVPNRVARQYRSIKKTGKVKDLGKDDIVSFAFSPDNNFYYIPETGLTGQFDMSAGKDLYYEFPAKATGNDCFHASPGVNDWYETVKLNYGVDYSDRRKAYFSPIPSTWKKMTDILLFWASKGIDAFRCDMAEMVPAEFWNHAIPKVKAKHKDLLFIGEIYNPHEYKKYLEVGRFDYLYDKAGLYDTLRNVICGYDFATSISRCWQQLGDMQHQMLNFLENHDEQRIASDFFAGNPFAAIPGMIVAATMNVNPVMIYNGQELGEKGMDHEGFSGIDGRTSIFDYWSMKSVRDWANHGKFNEEKLSRDQITLKKFYVKLLKLCNSEKSISKGLFYDLMYVNNDSPNFNPLKQYAYIRTDEETMLLIVVNFDSRNVDVAVKIPKHAFDFFLIAKKKNVVCTDLLSGETIKQNILPDEKIAMHIPAYSGRIYKWRYAKVS
jgi:glycosidase